MNIPTEESFAKEPLPSDVTTKAKLSTSTLEKARKRYIPAGRIPEILPNFPTSASKDLLKRDRIRQTNPSDHRIRDINTEIKNLVHNTRKKSG